MAKSKNDEKINIAGFALDNSVITYGNSIICVDNISLITICPIPPNRSWIGAIILGLLAILGMSSDVKLSAMVLIAAIIWFIIVCVANSNRGENLAISLNSGNTLYFHCKDRVFLSKVVGIMVKCIKEKDKATYSINFEKCQITGGAMNNSNFAGV